MPHIICPQCGLSANYILTQNVTITACANCFQATVMERNIIIKLDRDKFLGQAFAQREFLCIAVTAQALYKNWDTIINRAGS